MGAVIQGCATIILVEPIAARRDIGQELGATHVIDPAEAGDLAAALRAIVPAGLDFAFDTSGVVPVIEAGLAALGSHGAIGLVGVPSRSEEHTSELQSLMRISYAVFCLKKKKQTDSNSTIMHKI